MSMTESEATKVIEGHIQFLKENWKPHPDYDVIEALGMMLSEFRELKEKATAKPIEGTRFVEAICPKCENEILDTYWANGGIHYCPHCGIAIDWSEGKE